MLEPIVHEYELGCPPQQGLDVYVNEIGEWWHPASSANPDSLRTVTIESFVGGRVYATHSDIGEDTWGTVTVWEPPYGPSYSSTLAQSAHHPSMIKVQFTPDGDGCQMRFEHRGWNGRQRVQSGQIHRLALVLDRFAELANRDHT